MYRERLPTSAQIWRALPRPDTGLMKTKTRRGAALTNPASCPTIALYTQVETELRQRMNIYMIPLTVSCLVVCISARFPV